MIAIAADEAVFSCLAQIYNVESEQNLPTTAEKLTKKQPEDKRENAKGEVPVIGGKDQNTKDNENTVIAPYIIFMLRAQTDATALIQP